MPVGNQTCFMHSGDQWMRPGEKQQLSLEMGCGAGCLGGKHDGIICMLRSLTPVRACCWTGGRKHCDALHNDAFAGSNLKTHKSLGSRRLSIRLPGGDTAVLACPGKTGHGLRGRFLLIRVQSQRSEML